MTLNVITNINVYTFYSGTALGKRSTNQRRDNQNSLMTTLSTLLPFPKENALMKDKISVIRLTGAYLKFQKFLQDGMYVDNSSPFIILLHRTRAKCLCINLHKLADIYIRMCISFMHPWISNRNITLVSKVHTALLSVVSMHLSWLHMHIACYTHLIQSISHPCMVLLQ